MTFTKERIIGGLVVTNLVVTAAASRIVLKHNAKVEEQNKELKTIGNKLGRIATYQNKLLTEKMIELDTFDQIAFDNLTYDLNNTLSRLEEQS